MFDERAKDTRAQLPNGLDQRFCEVMDAAPVMIWVSAVNKECVWFNRPWLEFTGRTMVQELGDGWTQGVHPDDYARCLEIYVGHFEARTEFRMQYRLRSYDGVYRWIDDTGVPRHARDGTFLGYIGSCVNVAPLKETEIALRESETRLRLATSSANLGIFERDIREDRTIWVNDRMYEIFGRSPRDGPLTRELFLRDYLHPDDVPEFESATAKARATEGQLHISCRIRSKTGEERWLQIDGKYERSNSGEPLRLVGIAADVTERKILERRAAEISERLINVQEEERQRIAQELHDSTAQHLMAASLNLSTLKPKVSLTSDAARQWDTIAACLQAAQNEIRTFSYLMHPPSLQADGFTGSMQDFISGFSERTEIGIKIRLNPELDRLSFQMQRTLLRIAQEALVNVHRHANATRVRIVGRIIAGRVHLMIGDDGRGLQEGEKAPLGRGLRGMQDRCSQWNGELRIRSGSKGTRIHATWPVPH